MTLILLIILLIGLVVGYRRGVVLQFLHLIGTISAITIAALNYDTLGARLYLIMPYPSSAPASGIPAMAEIDNLEYAYYYMVAFFIIFIISKIVIQIIVSGFDYLQQVTSLGLFSSIGGTILGLIEVAYVLVIVLFLLATVPYDLIQQPLIDSGLANFILENTFIISDKLIEWIQIES